MDGRSELLKKNCLLFLNKAGSALPLFPDHHRGARPLPGSIATNLDLPDQTTRDTERMTDIPS